MSLSENEARVLEYLCQYAEFAWPFQPISADLKMTTPEVRLACRSLQADGLAKFCRGLMTEDGNLAGSGYSATHKGEQKFAGILENTQHKET